MSLNLGNDGLASCRALETNEHFGVVRKTLYDLAQKHANAALDAGPEHQARACGYAQAMRDVYLAIQGGTTGVNQNVVKKPGVKE